MSTAWKPSVTVAAIIERAGRYLLVEEQTRLGLKLNNPAGHLEPGETPAQGCAREALEECAHDFQPTAVVGIYLARSRKNSTGEDQTYLRMAFAGELGRHHPDRALDDGIERVLWMTLDEVRASAARHRSPLVLRCIEDHAAGVRHPLSLIYSDPGVLAPLTSGTGR
ncbi:MULTISPECIES: NUDIX hydrolase [Ramlibacter]|uniref:Phosphatase NudJ n=1 Tax=Ramlibacter aquaticus TaxID=2780094 RepID=A0ABR9SJL4_9BURK|nr:MULTISPECIES: NUDIX hydrolase [Ramlibacter]MBE7942556.1 NUDIX hydrolase [Ramlibacter aquaticus]